MSKSERTPSGEWLPAAKPAENVSPPENDRLDSWKEIAEFLGRDVHTCLRWEKEKGLPVHTIPGGKRRTVYAYKHEIDEWLAHSEVTEEAQEPHSPSRVEQLRAVWRQIPVFARAVLGILLLGFAGFGAYVVEESRSPALTTLLQDGNRLVAVSPNSSVAWAYEFPSGPVRILESVIFPQGNAKDAPGVLVSVNTPGKDGVEMHFFSPRGKSLWQFQPNDKLVFGAGEFGPPWYLGAQSIFQVENQSRIAIAVVPEVWWPSELLVLNLQGQVQERFINSGWIRSVYAMDRSNGPVLLISGISNSQDSGFFAVLDAIHVSGSSPEAAGSPFECKNCPPGRPLKYFIFPRSEVNKTFGAEVNMAGGTAHGDKIIIITKEGPPAHGQGDPEAVYEFSRDFQLKRTGYGDRYWELHRRLEKEGKIKHSKDACPERNGPRHVRQWDAQNGWQDIHPVQP